MAVTMGFAASAGSDEKALGSTWGGRTKADSRKLENPVVYDFRDNDGVGDLERLVRLLTHPETAGLSERQLVVLKRVCKVRQQGFRYSELPLVGQLLPLVENRILSGGASEFRRPLLKLLDICSLAPVRDRANQELKTGGLVASSNLFRILSRALWSSDCGIQSATAEVLRKIAAGNDPTRPNTPEDKAKATFSESLHDLRPRPRDINQSLLLGCGVVTSAVACLGNVVGSLIESLADLDDLSLESSSFGGSESDFQAEAQLVNRALGEQALRLACGEEGGAPGDIELATIKTANRQPSIMDPAELLASQSGHGKTTVSDMASKHSVLVSLLRFVRELSTNAASSASMVEAGLVSVLVQVLRIVRGVRDPTLSLAVEVMWNCLEHSHEAMTLGPPAESRTGLIRKARKRNAAFALSTREGVSALRDTIEALLVGGFRNKDKELRNEAVIVASQLAGNGRSHALFRVTGLLQLLLRCATVVETGLGDGVLQVAESEGRSSALETDEHRSSGEVSGKGLPEVGVLADPRNFATMTEVDLELKLLLWSLLAELSKKDPRNLDDIKASSLMETLLMYMDLVVEEGLCADAAPPGMSRSVSLASMPPKGTAGDAGSTALGTAASTNAEDRMRSPTGVSCTVGTYSLKLTPADSPLPSAERGRLGADPIVASSMESKFRSPENAAASKSRSDVWEREQGSPIAEGRGENDTRRPLAVGSTKLYIPATVVRLPVTSIQLLQSQAMASLLVLAPRFPRKFQALGGHMVTLRLLDRLGSPENQKLVKAATKLLATVVGLPGLKEEVGRMDGVRIMLKRFSDESKREPQRGEGVSGEGTTGNISGGKGGGGGGGGIEGNRGGGSGEGGGDLRTDTVIILCRLCDECPDNQEAFRNADGVPIIMAAIKSYCRARSEAKQAEAGPAGTRGGASGCGGIGERAGSLGVLSTGKGGSGGGASSAGSRGGSLDPALVHFIDCVWCAVVGNRRSEARLLQCEGLDTLLDLLEVCPDVMRHQVTGIVADLLRNKRAIPYARAWRSDLDMLSISQLMVRLWVLEEARLGVSRPNGVLQNLWRPLQSHNSGIGRRGWEKSTENGRRSGSRPQKAAIPTVGSPYNDTTSVARDSDPSHGSARSPGTAVNSNDSSNGNNNNNNDNVNKKDSSDNNDGSCAFAAEINNDRNVPLQSTLTSSSPECQNTGEARRVEEGDDDARSSKSVGAISRALQAGRWTSGKRGRARGSGERSRASKSVEEAVVAKAMEQLDLRGKIAAVLGMVGFDVNSAEGLGPSELKALYMATRYLDFREGEAWQEVAAELEAQHVNPIAADGLVLDSMLERAFDLAHEVKSKQTALTAEQGARDGQIEQVFFAGILFQRDQEIRQAVIKRNVTMPSASKKRLEGTKGKERMLKISADKPPVDGGNGEGGSGSGLDIPEEDAA